ncbi:MAG: hypothetical protein KF823_04460 [Xanthomonadales bacterium]|nr:hypothetical protein [Xanthomonadales bacterium]
MQILRCRITGAPDLADRIAELVADIEGVERATVMAGLVPHMDDPDSSSAGLAENATGEPADLEIELADEDAAQDLRVAIETLTRQQGAALEWTDLA